jgi:peptidoglycan/LPS O-acetylase OafA/YrhL
LLVPHEGFKDEDYGYAALSANIAIGIICALSLLGYRKVASSIERINVLRLSALGIAIISGCLAYAAQQSASFGLLVTLNLMAVLLLIILADHGRQRL